MDTNSIKRLESMASSLQQFFELEQKERDWIFPLLSKNIQSTIELLQIIENKMHTYEEIGDIIGLHFNTVKQKILALKRGGFPIDTSGKAAILLTGRPRNLSTSKIKLN